MNSENASLNLIQGKIGFSKRKWPFFAFLSGNHYSRGNFIRGIDHTFSKQKINSLMQENGNFILDKLGMRAIDSPHKLALEGSFLEKQWDY